MQTVLQNTDIEESLTKLASEDAFNPLDGGNLLDDAETVDEEQAPTEEPAEEEPQEEEAVAEVEEEESSEEEETEEEEEEAEEVEEEKDDFSGQLKKATKNIPTARDYSKYSEEDAKYLKQMSNEAFEHFSKKSSENIDLQKKLEDTSTDTVKASKGKPFQVPTNGQDGIETLRDSYKAFAKKIT